MNRRTYLGAVGGTVATVAGCAELGLGPPRDVRSYTFNRTEPFFDGQIPISESGFDGTGATTEKEITELNWEIFTDSQEEPYRSADPPNSFLTVACAAVKGAKRLNPVERSFDGSTLRMSYRLRSSKGDDGRGRRYVYELTKWESNGRVPEQIVVEAAPPTEK